MSEYLDLMTDLARKAGAEILGVYRDEDFGIETKDDSSPLTRADLAAHRVIVDGLAEAAPDAQQSQLRLLLKPNGPRPTYLFRSINPSSTDPL